MADTITLTFANRSSGTTETLRVVGRAAAAAVARWYGGYNSGDDYDVLIDGEIVDKDINGEI